MYLIVILCFISYNITLARVKYSGGGDWYNDASILPNLAHEINKRTTIRVDPEQHIVSLSDVELFNYPFIFITGHGDIKFSDNEVKQLREYLTKGGFLYADDDYGMDEYFRRETGKVFPGLKLEELPFKHPIYHSFYDFGYLPKIHKHDGKPPKGYGIFYQGRLVVFYTYETNISDGWADPWVHNDPAEKREEAFKMGVNILMYVLLHNE